MAPFGSAHSHAKGRNCNECRAVFNATVKLADILWYPHVTALVQVGYYFHACSAKNGLLHGCKTGDF